MITGPPFESRRALLAWADPAIDHAIELGQADQREASHRCLVEVSAHFPPDDPSPQAGRLWHALGVSWRHKTSGRQVENLLCAKQMLERARTHRARRAEPYRLAVTRDQLAVTLRHLARFASPDHAARLLARAEKLFDAALAFYTRLKPRAKKAQWRSMLVEVLPVQMNRANLYRTLDRLDDAIDGYRTVLREVRHAPPSAELEKAFDMTRLNLAGALLQRGRPSDGEAVERLLAKIEGRPGVSMGELRLLRARLYAEQDRDAEARQAILGLAAGDLPPERDIEAIELLAQLDGVDAAIEMAYRQIDRAFARRSTLISHGSADEAIVPAQQLAACVARLHVERDELVEAFLVLDNSAAIRFFELARESRITPRDRVGAELYALSGALDGCAMVCEDTAGRLSLMDDPTSGATREVVDAFSVGIEQMIELSATFPHRQRLYRRVQSAIAERRDAADLSAAFLALAQQLADEANHLRARLFERDPAVQRLRDLSLIPRRGLPRLLAAYPNEVFVRLSLLSDLLVVAVWFDGGRVQSRAHRVELADDHHRVIHTLHYDIASTASGRAAEICAALDLSPAFPPQRGGTVVFLPSRLAAMLPLAALGPTGRTPLDHFDAIRVMPSLDLLRLPPAVHAHRAGRVALLGAGTHRGEAAFDPSLPGERRVGPPVTADALKAALETADVVAIYAHGEHEEGELPSLDLGGDLRFPSLESPMLIELRGLERVELWACRSGSSAPADIRESWRADEFAGLDAQLVMGGARSALGSLLPLREGIAVDIARVYREGIAAGHRADRALADAMRWFRDVRLPTWPEDARPTLGCPSTWAALRVLGVCERRPAVERDYDPQAPLTDTEAEALDRLLAANDDQLDALHLEPIEWFEAEIARRVDALGTEPLRPRAAIELAALYRGRLAGEHRHNVVRALAWVHDALAASNLTDPDRHALAHAAAHLWLELAVEQAGRWWLVSTRPSAWPLLDRARALTETLPADEARAVRAICTWADPQRRLDTPEALASHIFEDLGDLATLSLDDLTLAVEVAAVAPHTIIDLLRPLADAARRRIEQSGEDEPAATAPLRLLAMLDSLRRRTDLPMDIPRPSPHWLTPRERFTLEVGQLNSLDDTMGFEGIVPIRKQHDTLLQSLDEAIWGRIDPPDPNRWRGTGGHGFDWWILMAQMPEALAHGEHDHRRAAPHLLASFQLGADLRTQQLNRWSVGLWRLTSALPDDKANELHNLDPRSREESLDRLVDAALVPGDEADPFALDISALRAAVRTPISRPAWQVATHAEGYDHPHVAAARTAAGRIARATALNDAALAQAWAQLVDGEARARDAHPGIPPLFSVLSAPDMRISELEEDLCSADAQLAYLTVGSSPSGLYAAVVHQGARRITTLDEQLDTRALWRLLTLPELNAPGPEHPSLADAWSSVRGVLCRLVEPLVREALASGVTSLAIFAPGALRSLPWMTVPIDGRSLAAHLAERGGRLIHLPALGWDHIPLPSDALDACLGVPTHAALRVALSAARSATAPRVLAPDWDVRRRHTELARLADERQPIGRLRVVGAGSGLMGVGYVSSVEVEPHHVTAHEIERLTFAPGAEFEVWASTDRRALAEYHLGARDRLPLLVRSALRAGARGALDLAWPIDPLVLALLCEMHALLTRVVGHDGAAGATIAVAWASAVLEAAVEVVSDGVELLEYLDHARRVAWRDAGCDAEDMPPLRGAVEPPAVGILRAEHALHLGAVRWWGS